MAITFDKEQFQKGLKKDNKKDDKVINTENDIIFTEKEEEILSGNDIVKKELKKRYNFSLRPSINRTLLIESKRRSMTKSELIEHLVENAFKGEE